MFHLKISTTNAAFEDNDRALELARILRETADRLERGYTTGTAVNSNGNQVGAWKVTR